MSAPLTAHGLVLVNPTDSRWSRNRYILAFGVYANVKCLVWANSLEEALDACVDEYIREYAPGFLCTDHVDGEYLRLVDEGMDECMALEVASSDCTPAGGYGDYIHSCEWFLLAEDPSRDDVLAIQGRAGNGGAL